MTPSTSSQGDCQPQLAQSLLDQLDPNKKQTVTQQLDVLISQVQDHSIGDFYAHVGKLIFRRISWVQPEDTAPGVVWLCAELCYSLFTGHLKRRSGLLPRVMLIHDHLFHLCIDSLSSHNDMECTGAQRDSQADTGPGAIEAETTTVSLNSKEVPLERIFELLLHLYEFQLIPLSQICEYMFRVIEQYKTDTGPRHAAAVTDIRFLLGKHFPKSYNGPWENEITLFREWVDEYWSSVEHRNNVIVDNTVQNKDPCIPIDSEDLTIKYRNSTDNNALLNSDRLSDDDDHPRPDAINESDSCNEMGLLAQIQDRGVEEMEYMEGNNLGKHPQTPVTSRSGSPVNTCAGKQVPMGVVEGTEQPPTSSIDFGLAGSSQASEDKMEAITLPTAASISIPTQPALASAAPTISTVGLTAHAAAISPSNTTPTSGKQKKVDVHALFQGRGVPLGTTTDTVLVSPEASTQPPATTPPIPPQWRHCDYYYLPPDSHYNPYAYWGTHPIYQHPHAPPAYPSRIPPPLPRSSNLRPSLAPATPGTELFDTLSVHATISLREPSNEPSPPSVDPPIPVPVPGSTLRRRNKPTREVQSPERLSATETKQQLRVRLNEQLKEKIAREREKREQAKPRTKEEKGKANTEQMVKESMSRTLKWLYHRDQEGTSRCVRRGEGS